jgi:hypothetical protein
MLLGGRKAITETKKEIANDLIKLLEPATRGDPESQLLWTRKSSYKLCEELYNIGYQICRFSVQKLLKISGYRLQTNKKYLKEVAMQTGMSNLNIYTAIQKSFK